MRNDFPLSSLLWLTMGMLTPMVIAGLTYRRRIEEPLVAAEFLIALALSFIGRYIHPIANHLLFSVLHSAGIDIKSLWIMIPRMYVSSVLGNAATAGWLVYIWCLQHGRGYNSWPRGVVIVVLCSNLEFFGNYLPTFGPRVSIAFTNSPLYSPLASGSTAITSGNNLSRAFGWIIRYAGLFVGTLHPTTAKTSHTTNC